MDVQREFEIYLALEGFNRNFVYVTFIEVCLFLFFLHVEYFQIYGKNIFVNLFIFCSLMKMKIEEENNRINSTT